MTSLPDLLRALDVAGAALARKGDEVTVHHAPPELIPALRGHKAVLRDMLEERRPLTATAARVRLLELALIKELPLGLVTTLNEADLAECRGLSDCQLVAFLFALRDATERMSGRVPPGDTAAIRCHQCGVVWAHPAIAAKLPLIRGLPQALGCPWCHVSRKYVTFPRPEVTL